jgi:hypothetical protein
MEIQHSETCSGSSWQVQNLLTVLYQLPLRQPDSDDLAKRHNDRQTKNLANTRFIYIIVCRVMMSDCQDMIGFGWIWRIIIAWVRVQHVSWLCWCAHVEHRDTLKLFPKIIISSTYKHKITHLSTLFTTKPADVKNLSNFLCHCLSACFRSYKDFNSLHIIPS